MRRPGGEKNRLSGKKWSEGELRKVYELYKELDGQGIHEFNPRIIELGEELGRTTRSVEAQIIMFRNLSRGGDYSYGNMSQLVRKIWEESQQNLMDTIKPDSVNNQTIGYWKSESKGGVRKPFDDNTGRPLRDRLHTPISGKIKALIEGPNPPKAIFLIGGPGNGKTDTMEYIVEQLDETHGLEGQLFSEAREVFKDYDWIEKIQTRHINIPYDSIDLVQDASDDDPRTEGGNPTKPLVDLLNMISGEEYKGLCVCCINRGILDSLKREVARHDIGTLISSKANEIFQSLMESIGPNGPFIGKSCWPFMDDYYAWPMDVDSLLDYYPDKPTIGEEILKRALVFVPKNSLFDEDPLNLNVSAIENDQYRRNLIKILRKSEIKGSYRFTFRELFALTAELFEDQTPKSTRSRGRGLSSFLQELDVAHQEWSELYYNKLFNNKGLFKGRGSLIEEVSKVKTKKKWEGDEFDVREALKIIFSKGKRSGSYINRVIDQNDFQSLDPGRSSSRIQIEGLGLSFSEIESAFSISIENGIEKCGHLLNEIEVKYLGLLSKVEAQSLDPSNITGSYQTRAEKIRGLLKRYCSIVAKRAIGARAGVVNEEEIIEAYLKALNNESNLREFIADALGPALFEKNMFKVSLGTTIGQPKESMKDDVVVYFEKGLPPRPNDKVDHSKQPDWSLIGIVDSNGGNMIINYELFQAIYRKGKLMEDAGCLSSEVMIGLDNIVSRISANRINSHYNLASDRLDLYLGDEVVLKIMIDGSFEPRGKTSDTK